MNPRRSDRLRGLAAAVLLLGLIVGPPLALVHFVGWPLPTRLPGFDEMTAAARGGIDDLLIVKALAVVGWLTWAQIAIASTVEIVALVRGRSAARAPVLAGLQVGVGRLVAAAALVAATWGTQRSTPLPMAHIAAVVAQPVGMIEEQADGPGVVPAAAVQRSAPASGARPSYVVQRNDSWWAIAERTLDDGKRWKELRAVNIGRAMPDGSVIGPATEIIRPGWPLLLLEDAAGTAQDTSVGAGEVEVRPGDNLWSITERHLAEVRGRTPSEAEVRERWYELIELNRDRFAEPDNPSRIYPGQRMRLSPPAAPAPTKRPQHPAASDQAPPETGQTPTAVPVRPDPAPLPAPSTTFHPEEPARGAPAARQEPAQPGRAPVDAVSDRKPGVPAALLGTASTLLAVGIASAVSRRRRRRQLQLPPRIAPPRPPQELDELRAEVAVSADLDQASRLHRAMRDVATALAESRSQARPRVVQVTAKHIEVLLSRPVPSAPPPWRAEASGSAWVLRGEPADDAEDGPAPAPALVSLGRPDGDAELYLDLEAEGVVALTGDSDVVSDLARSWILELATSPMSSGTSVVVVGGNFQPPSGLDRVRPVASWDEIAPELLTWVDQSSALIAANHWPTPFAGRIRGRHTDDLAPLVVFVDGPHDGRFRTFCDTILERQVAVVLVTAGGEVEGATRVEISATGLMIPSLGLSCLAQTVSPAAAEQVEVLLEDASRLPAQLTLMPEPAAPPPVKVGTVRDEYHDPPFEILVRLLGEICVVGGSRKLKPKQTAVVAYVALNAPVPSERIEDAVWVAVTASRRKRLANTISESRNALGAAHLPFATDGRYRVGPGVVTDLELFERRLAYAAGQDEEAAVVTIRGAVELVEGPVFTYRNANRASYAWVDVDNWISTWELKVTDAAEDLAERCLALGDLDGAVWAARRGLNASQTHTRLTKLLIQAYFAKGDAKAAARVFESHQAALEKLELDDVDADLIEFYQGARGARGVVAS